MKLHSRFACLACGTPTPLLSGHPECAKCGGLLAVDLVVEGTKKRAPSAWHKEFAKRAAFESSGVWMFREWVLPDVGAADVVTLGEGKSPLVAVEIGGRAAYVKQCGQQPTGSFKDLGMTVLVSAAQAIRRRDKKRVEVLACASTGDTSAALAAYGARAGIPVVVLLPKGKVSPAQLVQPLANGAQVLELDGDFDACMKVVADVGKRPGVFLANSKNPLRLLGQMTVAFELWRDLEWRVPDVVVVPSGNLGNVYAIHLGFTLLVDLGLATRVPRLVAAQVAAADPLHRSRVDSALASVAAQRAGETMATAIRIGDPVSFPRARMALVASKGTTTSASEDDVAAGMRVLDRQGLFACPQTGAAVAGAERVISEGFAKKKDVVVVVSTASGLKFSETKARVETNKPRAVAADVGAVAAALGLRT